MFFDLDRPLDAAQAADWLTAQGMAALSAAAVSALIGRDLAELTALASSWDRLPPDAHLRDGGRYRYRRHGSLVQRVGGEPELAPPRPHWQPTTYNALHGGLLRWFEPLDEEMVASSAWLALVGRLGDLFARARRPAGDRWFIEAHPFRITTEGGVGRPTPEGAHRDGVDFVAVVLVGRSRLRGGETRVFEADGPRGVRFTLTEPWSAILLDDARVIHESTPIQPEGDADGHRDTLILTYRSGGFQDPIG